MCLWSIGEHTSLATRWTHGQQEPYEGVDRKERGEGFLQVSLAEPHRHIEVKWWDLDLYV